MVNYEKAVKNLIKDSDITIGKGDGFDISVLDDDFYRRVFSDGSLGLGESYMDGMWESKNIDVLVYKLIRSGVDKKVRNWKVFLGVLYSAVINSGSKLRSFNIGKKHYDIGNDLYKKMLDKRMVYTCGYWKDASNLDEAQEHKLDLVCRKLYLKPNMKVLDIGCGFGSFAKYASEKYGVEVVGVTVSEKQVELAKEICKGLPVDIRLQDYRDVEGKFDRIVSLGMFEHVGYKNYKTYMKKVNSLLKDDGLFLLHTIGSNYSLIRTDRWIDKYIFPGGMTPSISQIGKSIESFMGVNNLFVMEDWHNFGADYDKTLMEWFYNFDKNWPSLKEKYGDRFYRMWKFYLLSCAGSFRARRHQLWQIVLSKKGILFGYQSIR